MAQIIATFDTVEKTLAVTMDGKKQKDISEIDFYAFGDKGSVEMRSSNYDEEKGIYTIVKVLANEDGITETTETKSDVNHEEIVQALFPRRFNP